VIRDELRWLLSWSEHHRKLALRLGVVLAVTLAADMVGAVLMWSTERHAHGTEIHDFGDALFFSTVQLLTISSQLKNPLTTAGRFVDVGLEIWGIGVVGSIAGSFGSFFLGGDNRRRATS
jgi:hypothetical protein